jgi:hypothetical protein
MMRNEIFNSKSLSSNFSNENVNNFTVKPIRGEDGNNQICVTFSKNTSNAISFFVEYRLKGSEEWVSTHVEKVLNVINIKNLSPGIYQIRIVSIGARQQIPSNIKEIEIMADSPNNRESVSDTIENIASNLADDIIAEVYFNLSNADLIHNIEDKHGLYDQNDMTYSQPVMWTHDDRDRYD